MSTVTKPSLRRSALASCVAIAAVIVWRPSDHPASAEMSDGIMTFILKSSAFAPQASIPTPYTCEGADHSLPLSWTDPPPGTKSLALIMEDPDAPAGTWVHWVAYNLPAMSRSLPEGLPTAATLPDGSRQGLNDFHRPGYGGPCPPPGPAHRYVFTLYALKTVLELPPNATKAKVEGAMAGQVLGHAQLIGLYQRRAR